MEGYMTKSLWLGAAFLLLMGVFLEGCGLSDSPAKDSAELQGAYKAPAVDVSKIGLASLDTADHSGMSMRAHLEAHFKVEDSVFRTPGGLYTQADIDKNGDQTPAVKFDGIPSRHDIQPRKGDLLCPITMTKANPNFYWWIAGKRYTFCCPPCIEEMVIKAKKAHGSLPPPESFRQK